MRVKMGSVQMEMSRVVMVQEQEARRTHVIGLHHQASEGSTGRSERDS